MIGSLAVGVTAAASVLALGGLGLEFKYRQSPGNDLELTPGEWHLTPSEPNRFLLVGEMEFRNRTPRFEIMLPEVQARVKLLSDASLEGVSCKAKVIPCHKDATAREDGYWFGYIVKLRQTTKIKVSIEIQGRDLSKLQSAWIQIQYVTYGPGGRIPKLKHLIVPLQFPEPSVTPKGRDVGVAEVFPIRTHLLGVTDDPVAIVKRYALPHAQKGDIIAIGETPIAVIQGRFRHPTEIKPGWVAKRVCLFFLPTSSLATACGMQALVDLVGPVRVLAAFAIGAVAKVFGKPGVFYQLAGEQARLIDDVTGTLPPYDQFIVLGPDNPQQVVDRIQQETGLAAAIVDANDLKAVKILAATPGLPEAFLEQALISNPAGNADERTPLVLIRPAQPLLKS
ncbi:MAG: F420-0:Gamma-glutamyl ligase [Actinomycetota bacterium]